jgi:hypothetical protein
MPHKPKLLPFVDNVELDSVKKIFVEIWRLAPKSFISKSLKIVYITK